MQCAALSLLLVPNSRKNHRTYPIAELVAVQAFSLLKACLRFLCGPLKTACVAQCFPSLGVTSALDEIHSSAARTYLVLELVLRTTSPHNQAADEYTPALRRNSACAPAGRALQPHYIPQPLHVIIILASGATSGAPGVRRPRGSPPDVDELQRATRKSANRCP